MAQLAPLAAIASSIVSSMRQVIRRNRGPFPNHAHAFTIPAVDFDSTVDKTYTMSGGYAHSVTLTPAQLATLRAGQTVSVTSTAGNGHTHACKCA